jgi:hypothetical protein
MAAAKTQTGSGADNARVPLKGETVIDVETVVCPTPSARWCGDG